MLGKILYWVGWICYAPGYVIGYLFGELQDGFKDGFNSGPFGGYEDNDVEIS